MFKWTVRLTLFWRLMVGYSIIFIMVMTVGVYAVVQLKRFNEVARHILNVNNKILEFEKNLVDTTLSQHRFFKKYIITKDQDLYSQFLAAKEAFNNSLSQAKGLSEKSSMREALKRIEEFQDRYQTLAGTEHNYIQTQQAYPIKEFNLERENLVDMLLKNLDELEAQTQKDIQQRMKDQGEAGDAAGFVAALLSMTALISIIIISLLITRSITTPLRLLRLKTREISEGQFRGDLQIASSPEILELAEAFNVMSHKLMTLDKMKSDFFSTMSHELRTPLTSIKEGIALLEEEAAGPVTGKQKKLLSIIAQESQRLIELVNSSLDLSKMEAGKMTYRFEPGAIAPFLAKVAGELGPLLEAKKINLAIDIKDNLPVIKMDHERILQVLRNLFGNAIKFTPEGGTVTISAQGREGGIQVAVGDTGPGIPEKYLLTIFNKFHQVIPAKSYQIKGSGLGLAIVKYIIQSHGGRIWAESTLGQGSVFYFWLPA